MNVATAVSQAARQFAQQGIEDSRVQAELLMCHVLGVDRVGLYIRMQEQTAPEQEKQLQVLVERRLQREPLAYITGRAWFYGLDFIVDRRVLIPRQETEVLVERAMAFLRSRGQDSVQWTVADVGTGSGNIAVALAFHMPHLRVYALDSSQDALEVTPINCKRHRVEDRVRLLHGDLLSPLPEPVDVIVANLPYVTTEELTQVQPEISRFEPPVALDGGTDGLNIIRRLLAQAPDYLRPDGAMFLEIGPSHPDQVTALLQRHLPDASIQVSFDLEGSPRVISAEREPKSTFSAARPS